MSDSTPDNLVQDVRGLQKIAYGFMGSKALFAALNLNVFGRLAEDPKNPKTLGELTLQTEAPRNLLRTLLTACVSLGLLIKDGESYRNSPAAQRYLDPESDSYFGDYYRFQIDRQVYPAFESLDAALRGKAVRGLYTDAFEDPQRAADFFRGQHSGSLGPAFVLARQVELEGRRTVLDVGGGNGTFSILLCRRFPRLTATILDFPRVIEVAKTYVDEAGLTGRIGFAPGEAVSDDWPRGQDVVLMSYLLSAVDQQHHLPLMRKAWNCLAPGGLLLVHDFAVNDNGEASLEAALWGLAMMIGNAGATNLSPDDLIAYGTETGFERVHVRPLIEGITSLLTCTKPGSAGLD